MDSQKAASIGYIRRRVEGFLQLAQSQRRDGRGDLAGVSELDALVELLDNASRNDLKFGYLDEVIALFPPDIQAVLTSRINALKDKS